MTSVNLALNSSALKLHLKSIGFGRAGAAVARRPRPKVLAEGIVWVSIWKQPMLADSTSEALLRSAQILAAGSLPSSNLGSTSGIQVEPLTAKTDSNRPAHCEENRGMNRVQPAFHVPGTRFEGLAISQEPPSRSFWPLPKSSPDDRTCIRFLERLEAHPHFRGRSQWIRPSFRHGVLRLNGCLPNFYLKQIVQVLARELPEVRRVVNRIEVRDYCGSVSPPTGLQELGAQAR